MNPIDAKNIHSICINCCGLIGDTLIRTPFIEAIKKKCPHATIAVITDIDKTTLLEHHPDVNKVIAFNRNKKPILKYLKDLLCLIKSLRKAHYDLMINLYGGGSSAQITKLSNAKYRWGFYRNEKEKNIYTDTIPWPNYIMDSLIHHWGQHFGLLLEPFNISPAELRAGTTFITTEQAKQKANVILQTVNKPWVLFNMGAGDAKKMWPVRNYVQIAKWLQLTYDYHVGVFVNPGQEQLIDEFKHLAQQEKYAAFTPLNINDFSIIGALLEQAKFFITGDTGLLHIAFGVKAPTVAIFTHTRPEHVWAEDVNAVYCFIEDKNKVNEYDIKMGMENIPIAYVKEKIVTLQHQLTN